MEKSKNCTGCGKPNSGRHLHPILRVPVCKSCWDKYHEGEFTIVDGNEIYCRWCGEGGELVLCDGLSLLYIQYFWHVWCDFDFLRCPKGFCKNCISRNFGTSELYRIIGLDDRWSCYVCAPQAIEDLCVRHGWIRIDAVEPVSTQKPHSIHRIYDDVSRGRETFEIPVYNEIDRVGPPLDFTYITQVPFIFSLKLQSLIPGLSL